MTPTERRASVSLASIFALRMLGLFVVLPVFALEARAYPGGSDPALLGLAMGMYGLTQALLQLPLGMASDRFGRKRVMVLGLLVFALGSVWAALATDVMGLLWGRGLQGAGAVSAAVSALLADLTRDEVRTKAMAGVGASIGLMFALSLVAAPLLTPWLGLPGLFALTAVLALVGVAVTLWGVPPEPARTAPRPQVSWWRAVLQVLAHAGLWRLHLGVFVLHAVQLAMWSAVPALLEQAGLARSQHWHAYLPAVLAAFVLMGGVLSLERRGHLKPVFLSAIGLMACVQVGLLVVSSGTVSVLTLTALLFGFFCGFNVLEATQPSLVSKLAPAALRGTAMGVYNTLQSLGLFVGGWMGGVLIKAWGSQWLFVCCAAALCVWWILALPMRVPAAPGRALAP